MAGRRLAFVVNADTAGDLTGGNRDSSRVFLLLTDPEVGACAPAVPSPIHNCPAQDDFLRFFRATLSDWQSDDQLVFYFSGHGNVVGGVYCLRFGSSTQEDLPFSHILDLLKMRRVSRAILILDACHSGDALTAKADPMSLGNVADESIPMGIAILASSHSAEKSYEVQDGSASVFTKLLCEGITSGLDGSPTSDGFIGIADIIDYVKRKLQTPEYVGYPQKPVYKIWNADRSIWLAKNKAGSLSTTDQSPTNAVRNMDELRFAYEQTAPMRRPCEGASLADIDWALVDRHMVQWRAPAPAGTGREALLEHLGLFSPLSPAGRRLLHNAAVLCFCSHPEKYIPQARAVLIAGGAAGAQVKRIDVFGPLSMQVGEIVEWIKGAVGTVATFDKGALRGEEPEIPADVIREVVSNAVVHRDYNVNQHVQVRVSTDWVEVQSPGAFPYGATWDSLMARAAGSCPVDAAIAFYVTNLLAFEGVGRGFEVFRRYIDEQGEGSVKCEWTEHPPSITVQISRRHRGGSRIPARSADEPRRGDAGTVQDTSDAHLPYQRVYISYGGPDEDFARRLYEHLLREGVPTFFFAEHAIPGKKLHRQMREQIRQTDRVLLVCSRASLDRQGVLNEIEESLARESSEGGSNILIPVVLDDYIYAGWSPNHEDLAQAIRGRVAADFRDTDTDAEAFARAVEKLIRALKRD